MFYKYFNTDSYEDKASEYFRLDLPGDNVPEAHSKGKANETHNK